MIASVSGRVAAVAPDGVIVEVGGVGLDVQCTPRTLATLRIGDHATLATSLVVREDSLTLYGFLDADERGVFEILQTASGVGPRLAQAMLGVHGPDDLRRILATDDTKALTLVPGIGTKGAQRIVLELRDRIGPQRGNAGSVIVLPTPGRSSWQEQVRSGLLGLGWSTNEADEAVSAVSADLAAAPAGEAVPDVAALLRSALRALNRSGSS